MIEAHLNKSIFRVKPAQALRKRKDWVPKSLLGARGSGNSDNIRFAVALGRSAISTVT